MRILLATLGPPLPADRGASIRDFELIRRLASRHELVLAPIVGPGTDLEPLRALRPLVAEVAPIPSAESLAHVPLRVPLLATGMPVASLPYLGWRARGRFTRLLAEVEPATVQVEHPFLAPLLAATASSRPRVLSLHNVTTEQYASMARATQGLERRVNLVKQRLCARLERDHVPRFEAVVVVSRPERDAVLRLDPAADVTVVDNGVDTRRLRPLDRPGLPSVLFVANLTYPPNEDAARWLCERIVPALRTLVPRSEVRVVGAGGSRSLHRIAARAGVEMAGPVPDVVRHYEWASVCVAPLRSGGGSRLKILEAMALGRPVVSTSLGALGLELEPDRHLAVADDAEEIARRIARLLDDERLWLGMAAEARARVECRYDWDLLTDRLAGLHERLARR